VAFDRENGVRVGIFVIPLANIPGYPSISSVYGRTQLDKLHRFIPNPDLPLETVFILEENHFQDLELAEYDIFLIRNMLKWPEGRAYRLASALSSETWEKHDETFRCFKHDNHERPFVLVFRRDGPDNKFYNHFIVTVGRDINPNRVKEIPLPGQTWPGDTWCDAVFRRVEKVEHLDLETEIQLLRREDKTVEAHGNGIILKVHVRAEIISGQTLYCVDFFAKAADEEPFYCQS
jgi:hypothetical protein